MSTRLACTDPINTAPCGGATSAPDQVGLHGMSRLHHGSDFHDLKRLTSCTTCSEVFHANATISFEVSMSLQRSACWQSVHQLTLQEQQLSECRSTRYQYLCAIVARLGPAHGCGTCSSGHGSSAMSLFNAGRSMPSSPTYGETLRPVSLPARLIKRGDLIFDAQSSCDRAISPARVLLSHITK